MAIAFRAGFWNIGVEGQLLMGAVAAAGIGPGRATAGRPSLVLPLMVVGGALAGAAWVLVPALLRVRLGIDEVVTTLLLNPVALLLVEALLHGPWRDPETGFPESPRIAEPRSSQLTFLPFLGKSRLHLGLHRRPRHHRRGLVRADPHRRRACACGPWASRPHAARFAGIKVERTLLRVALVSGAIAGIAGVSEVAGIQLRLTAGISPGFGYTGIVVAMLGGLTMPGVLLAGLLLGDLDRGRHVRSRAACDIPSQLGAVVQGTLLLVVVGAAGAAPARRARRLRAPARRGRAARPPSRESMAPVEAAAGMTFLVDLLAATFRNATPLVYGTIGETYTERPASSTWASRAPCTRVPSRASPPPT